MDVAIIYIAMGVIGLLVILLILSAGETIPDGIDYAFFTCPFYKFGKWIYRRIFEDKDGQSGYYQRIYNAQHTLSPAGKTGEEVAVYFIKKVGLCTLVLFMGMAFIIILKFSDSNEQKIVDGRVARPEVGEHDISFSASITVEGEEEILEEYKIDIPSRKYSAEEVEAMLPKFYEDFEKVFLYKNSSLTFINSDVRLPSEVQGYPFLIEYSWPDKNVINRQGEIGDDISSEGIIIPFEVKLKYLDSIWLYEFSVCVYPRELSRKEYLNKRITELIETVNRDSETLDYMELPRELDGVSVIWTEEKEEHMLVFFLLIIAGVIAIYMAQDNDLYKKVDERDEQMMDDYTEIVSKLTLLIGAGMTVRAAFRKVAFDYKTKRDEGGPIRYAYEEMLFTIHEMDNGVEEALCYSHFSSRARVQKYVKLVSLLEQNLKLGVGTMLITLREETRDAFEERKSRIEKISEEAGTKLLVPMMLMLVVVVVVIMFPAFMSM